MLLFVSLFYLLVSSQRNALNQRPIIGILTNPDNDQNPSNSTIAGSYVFWLSQGGARVAVIPFDLPTSDLYQLVKSLNGVFFQGGDNTLTTSSKVIILKKSYYYLI